MSKGGICESVLFMTSAMVDWIAHCKLKSRMMDHHILTSMVTILLLSRPVKQIWIL